MEPIDVRKSVENSSVEHISSAEYFPLSAAQRATWFAQQIQPDVPISIAHYVELRGELDVDLLRQETVAVAHEFQSPLLKVIEVDGRPMQYVDNTIDIPVDFIDFRGEADPVAAAHELMNRDYQRQLDLGVDRLVETSILCVGPSHYLWYSRIHHVALDGYGAMTMMNRIAHRYSAAVADCEPDLNHAAAQRELYEIDSRYRSSDRYAADREYWATRTSALEGSTLSDVSAPSLARSKVESALLSGAACVGLEESERQAATVVAAIACYLARMTSKTSVLVNVPLSGRTTSALRKSGGMMVNVAPLAISVDEGVTVSELVSSVQQELMGALRHQRCSLDDIRRDLGRSGDGLSGPMVNVMLFRQSIALGSMVGEYHIVTSGPVEDLLINVYPSGMRGEIFVDFRANPNRYTDSALRTHHTQFVELLEEFIASDPGAKLDTIHRATALEGERRHRIVDQLEYWKNQLSGIPELLKLPSDRARPASQSLRVDGARVQIGADTHRRVIEVAADHSATSFAVLHAAFAVLLSRLSGTSDVVVGTAVSGPADIIVLRTRVEMEMSFAHLLCLVRDTDAEAFDHSEVPFEELVRSLEIGDSQAYSPIAQVMFEDRDGEEGVGDNGIGRFDLRVTASEVFDEGGNPAGITVNLGFATDLFDAETVRGLGTRFRRILEAVTITPDIGVGDIDILVDAERRTLVPVQGAVARSDRTLPELFDAAAQANPDGVALSYCGVTLTYREVDDRSNQLARVLVAQGIGTEDYVALGIARSIESVLSVLAIAKTGAAFVPVDPSYPADRIQHMLDDSGAAAGVTVSADRSRLPNSIPWLVLDDPEFRTECSTQAAFGVTDAQRIRPLHRDNPAYVIYTSGSTGRPKGIPVTHRGLDSLAAEHISRFGATQDSRILHFSTPSFDASISEYLHAFGAGATMVIVPPTIYGGEELSRFLRNERVTHGFITTAALGTVEPEGLSEFQDVVFGGEACPPELVKRWAPGRRLCNAYGPTEATVMANISERMSPADAITLGGPLRGICEVVLDARLKAVPLGVAGELYVAGEALARGYHGKSALTAERFVANPFGSPGERMYRTGDVVRWRTDRTLEYVGRSDFQVKVRGFRIELGEIDTVLHTHPHVRTALTTSRPGPSGDTMLVSYVVPAAGQVLVTAQVMDYAAEQLPTYMIPAAIVVLDEMPMTAVGKVDRAALPAPQFVSSEAEFRAPTGRVEQTVAQVLADVLGVARIGRGDSFFDLGGNSLAATRVIARLNRALGVGLGVRTLFEAPTVETLAQQIGQAALWHLDRPVLTARSRPGIIPVSPAQQRIWFINQFDTSSSAYNIPMVVRLSGDLDVAALRAALGDVIERHESLRTVYPASADGPHQMIVPSAPVVPDLRPQVCSDVETSITEFASRGFDVSKTVPVRGVLFRTGPDEHVLLLVVHHISADGASLAPLARDLAIAYDARVQGQSPDWNPLPVHYADFSLWQTEILGSDQDPDSIMSAQLDYWKSALSDLPGPIDLPLDRPRPRDRSLQGGIVKFSVSPALHRDLLALARQHNSTLFMVMHAALVVLAARLSGSTDITIGTPIGGRGEEALDDLVGMFVNTVVLRTAVDPGATFAQTLSEVRKVDLEAFGHTEVPFERVVEALAPDRSTSHSPLFQILLEFQNTVVPNLELPGLTVEVVDVDAGVSKFDLQLALAERHDESGSADGISGAFTFASDVFDRLTVSGFGQRFIRILESVVAESDRAVGDIEVLGPGERELVLDSWNATGHALPGVTLADLFDAQVARTPGAVAVVFEGTALSYREFDARVNRLARFLISVGVGPEVSVGVAVGRSVELLVAIYAVVKAGGAFVPVDVDQPVERVGFAVSSAGAVLILTVSGGGGGLPVGVRVVELDVVDVSGFSSARPTDADRVARLLPEHPAYVMFTSGSTGRPKGVVVPQVGVVNRLLWMQDRYPLSSDDVVLQKTPVTFDVSVWELFWPLIVGARVVVAVAGGHRDPVYLSRVIVGQAVTVVHFVPSMLDVFVAESGAAACVGLRRVFASGESLSVVSAVRLRDVLPGVELHNLYGPTEASVDVTFHEFGSGVVGVGSVPIGVPVWNTRVFVLDSRLRPVPVGVVGELYLGGVQLARGYVGRADLTADRFVADPFGG
ncbi:non-ribosomal peptide synthetase, partial [Rhodococcus sp. SRB_17]|nr:non-ribosomal peptide synthetase [Rhodococcus sp. SRB_17]